MSTELDFDFDDLVLDYRLRHHVWALDEPERFVEQWHVRASLERDDGSTTEVATAELVRVDVDRVLATGATPYDLLDAHSADLEAIAGEAFDLDTGELCADLEDLLEGPDAGVLVLDRVRVEPCYRGREIGPLVAACALATLRQGCGVALCFPSPLENPAAPGPDLDAAVARLAAVWAKVGFEPYTNGVHVLDLATTALSDSLEQIHRRIRSRRALAAISAGPGGALRILLALSCLRGASGVELDLNQAAPPPTR
jgi:hypothetical protein